MASEGTPFVPLPNLKLKAVLRCPVLSPPFVALFLLLNGCVSCQELGLSSSPSFSPSLFLQKNQPGVYVCVCVCTVGRPQRSSREIWSKCIVLCMTFSTELTKMFHSKTKAPHVQAYNSGTREAKIRGFGV